MQVMEVKSQVFNLMPRKGVTILQLFVCFCFCQALLYFFVHVHVKFLTFPTDPKACFEIIQGSVSNTQAEPFFLSILQHLLYIRDDLLVRQVVLVSTFIIKMCRTIFWQRGSKDDTLRWITFLGSSANFFFYEDDYKLFWPKGGKDYIWAVPLSSVSKTCHTIFWPRWSKDDLEKTTFQLDCVKFLWQRDIDWHRLFGWWM